MALTITAAGSANSTTSGATLDVTSVTAAVGDMLVIMIAADNAGASGVASISSVTDSTGVNVWTQRQLLTYSPGSVASDGTTLGIFTSVLTSALSAGTVTVNFSPNTTSKAAVIWKIAGGSPSIYAVGTGATGSSTDASSGVIASVPSGYTVIGVVAAENTGIVSNDPDTTNGSWSTAQSAIATTGTPATSQSIASQWKTVNATGNQTYDRGTYSGSRDWAASGIVLFDAAIVGSASGIGSASGVGASTAAAAGAAAGAGAAAAAGASTAAGVGAAAGIGAASATGTAIHALMGAASGLGAAAGVFRITYAGAGEASGVGQAIGRASAAGPTTGTSWPDTLPAPTIAGYSLAPAPNVVRTAMEFGAPRARRKGTRPLCRVEVGFTVTTWQQMLFESFYRWRAEEGAGWFDIELAFPSGLAWCTARFAGDVRQQPLAANVWRTTATLEVLERPILSDAALTAILDDAGADPAWPSDESILPRPTYEGYGLTDHAVLARSGDDLRGLPQQRLRSRNRVTDVSCRWVLTADQAATWDGFFVHRALEGARWFSMPVFGGIGLASASARFIGETTWTPLGNGIWAVEAPMEVRERPILRQSDLDMPTSEDLGHIYATEPTADETLEEEDSEELFNEAAALDDLMRGRLWGPE